MNNSNALVVDVSSDGSDYDETPDSMPPEIRIWPANIDLKKHQSHIVPGSVSLLSLNF